MKSTKFLHTVLLICALSFGSSNCSSALIPTATSTPSSTPTATPTLTPTTSPSPSPSPAPSPSLTPEPAVAQPGHWEGEGLSFDITSAGIIHDLAMTIPFGEGIDCIMTMEDITVSPEGSFSASSPSPLSSSQTEINLVSGQFLDATNMSGVFGGTPILCEIDNVPFFFEVPLDEQTINATWKNALMTQEETLDGIWSGTTSAGKKFEFVVENNVVNSFLVEFDSMSGCESPYQLLNAAAEITENTFSKTGLFSTITGMFSSGTSASGEITLACTTELKLTWTASKNP